MGHLSSTNERKANGSSLFCDEFVEIVQLILDGEAKQEHRERFNKHYMKCKHCVNYYDLEAATHSFIRSSISKPKLNVPDDLVRKIKSEVRQPNF